MQEYGHLSLHNSIDTDVLWERVNREDADGFIVGLCVDTLEDACKRVASELGLLDEEALFIIVGTFIQRQR